MKKSLQQQQNARNWAKSFCVNSQFMHKYKSRKEKKETEHCRLSVHPRLGSWRVQCDLCTSCLMITQKENIVSNF